jgi:hypothetical protein
MEKGEGDLKGDFSAPGDGNLGPRRKKTSTQRIFFILISSLGQ